MKVVLTIAGSDPSGGAGVQADIKTITAHALYAESAVTALTAQNTQGVAAILPTPPEFLEQQLSCIFSDIPPDAVKIGMLPGIGQMEAVRAALQKYRPPHIVLDTIILSTSGTHLMPPEALSYFQSHILPLVDVYTPNLPEAGLLLKASIKTREERVAAVRQFALQYKGAVYLKGGHDTVSADDLLFFQGVPQWIPGEHIPNPNTHGTGCTLSSAIACGLACGLGIRESARRAKAYITGAIADGLDLGKGNGPLNHMYRMKGKDGRR